MQEMSHAAINWTDTTSVTEDHVGKKVKAYMLFGAVITGELVKQDELNLHIKDHTRNQEAVVNKLHIISMRVQG